MRKQSGGADNRNRRLLFSVTREDCDWQYFTVGGNGGSGKDTSNTGVRCTHKQSGAVGRAVDNRSRDKNRQLAFTRMVETKEYKAWWTLEVAKRTGQLAELERIVDRQMDMQNIKVETFEPDDSNCTCYKDSNGTRKCDIHR